MIGDDDFSDDLSDMLGKPVTDAMPVRTPKAPPEHYEFRETCPKCGGTGKFIRHGRTYGDCYACKGKGANTFKTSPEQRAKGRASAAARAERKAAELVAMANEWREQHPHEWDYMTRYQDLFLRGVIKSDFCDKMCNAVNEWGSLTPGQLAAIQSGMLRDAERREAREAGRPAVDASKIAAAFAAARARAARPGMEGMWTRPLVLRANEIDIAFQPGSIGSQWESMIFAKVGDKKIGHIKDGKFSRKFECTDAEVAAVVECCADPLTAANAHAKAWRRCGICSRTLTNDESIARGIGPICAEKYGWGF